MYMKYVFRSLLVLLAVLTAAGFTKGSTVIVVDTSVNASSYLPQELVEARELLGQIPDGEPVTIVRTAPVSKIIFDARLDSQTRLTLGVALLGLRPAKVPGDLGAAVAMAASLAAGGTGPKRIVVLTSAQPQPSRRSAFFGRSLTDILSDRNVLPDSIDIMIVRVHGGSAVTVNRANVHILKVAPSWQRDLQLHMATPVPPSNRAPLTIPIQQRSGIWVLAGAIILILVAVLLAIYVRRSRRQTQAQLAADEAALMLAPSEIASDPDEAESVNIGHLVFNVDTGEGEVQLAEGQRILVGDRWDAEPQFEARGACIRLSALKEEILIENAGLKEILIGAFRLAPGLTRRLPARYMELTLGQRVVSVMPEVVDSVTSAN